jgi:hypothetical protein
MLNLIQNVKCYLSMMRPSVASRKQPEVTPVVPFKNKIQYYQLKQSFLIILYFKESTIFSFVKATKLLYTGVPELADQTYSAFSLVITESNSV